MATFLKLKSKQLRDRLDAVYYRPIFLQNEERLRSSTIGTAKLSALVERGRRAIYFSTSTLERGEAPESWVPFLTSDDLGDDGFFIDLEARRYVAPEFAAQYPQGKLRANELLIKVKGPNQTTAYIEREPERPVLVSGTIWGGLVRRDKVDPHFLVTALSSPYAAIARSRLRTNTNVEFLAAEDLLNLQLPLPNHRSAQAYIGDKVRQAERLRARARATELTVIQFNERLIPSQAAIDFDSKSRLVGNTALTERLDAHFYPVAVEKYLQSVNCSQFTLDKLCVAIFNGQTQSETDEGGSKQATVANLSSIFLRGPYRSVIKLESQARCLQTHDLLICNAAHSKSYIGRDITYFQGGAMIFPSTEVMVIRVDRTIVPASYIRAYLRTKIGYLQIQSTIRGISAHSYPSDMNALRIPVPEVQARDEWLAMDEAMATAGTQFDLALNLTLSAKLLVEALIEGKLSEAELKEAQGSFERGEREADRAILARLTRKGIDAAGEPPLFSDLDALYAALDQTADAATQNQYEEVNR